MILEKLRPVNWIQWLTLAMFVLLVFGTIKGEQDRTVLHRQVVALHQQEKTAAETHAALCVYRHDIIVQARQTTRYLDTHPHGIPALGISRGTLVQQVHRQRAAVRSLVGLACQP